MTENKTTIECIFNDENALYAAYMPFIEGGGLFIRTQDHFKLGATISLLITLPQQDQVQVESKVAWLTPKGAQGSKPAGIGIQLLGEEGRLLRNKIETILAGMLKSTQPTDTL